MLIFVAVTAQQTAYRNQMWNLASKDYVHSTTPVCEALNKLFTLTSTYESQLAKIMKKRLWNPKSPTGDDATRFYPSIAHLQAEFGKPYRGATSFGQQIEKSMENVYRSSAQVSSGQIRLTVQRLIGAPRSILEVGSFIGSGIVYTWAPLVQDGTVISLDTWDGALVMKLHSHDHITKLSGRSLYETFLSRMVTRNLTNAVFPMRMSSLVGARLLYYLGYKFDLIYVDSAHEIGETLIELKLFYDLLRPGGMMMGDDYDWLAVKHDIALFGECTGTTIHKIPNTVQWYVHKSPRG